MSTTMIECAIKGPRLPDKNPVISRFKTTNLKEAKTRHAGLSRSRLRGHEEPVPSSAVALLRRVDDTGASSFPPKNEYSGFRLFSILAYS